jgi:copper chaperone CopZ
LQTKLTINGMTCGHCEARVKRALEAIGGVDSADVSHAAKSATVTHDDQVGIEDFVAAVTKAGYEVADS